MLYNFYRQLDFEVVAETRLLESQTMEIWNHAKKWLKENSNSLKGACYKIMSVIAVRFTFKFFQEQVLELTKKMLKDLKK
jgi:hypothetical protein